MNIKTKINKIKIILYRGKLGKILDKINSIKFRDKLYKSYTELGVKFGGIPCFIYNDCYFDGTDYSVIKIGKQCVISREVIFLTHDFSLSCGYRALEIPIKNGIREQSVLPITIGDNCFIGARATILGGTSIGDNCIVGAGAVVKGEFPDNSIIIGNPAKVIKNTKEWAENNYNKDIGIK